MSYCSSLVVFLIVEQLQNYSSEYKASLHTKKYCSLNFHSTLLYILTLQLEFNQNLLSGDEFIEEDVDIVVSVITDFNMSVDTEVKKLDELFKFFKEFIEDAIEYLNSDNAEVEV